MEGPRFAPRDLQRIRQKSRDRERAQERNPHKKRQGQSIYVRQFSSGSLWTWLGYRHAHRCAQICYSRRLLQALS